MLNRPKNISEYVIVGAGPAAITAIASLLKTSVSGRDITWIDPNFTVGDFGGKLSAGSSVPGNTSVENYQKVYREIYKIISAHTTTATDAKPSFVIDECDDPTFVCSLKHAAEPLHYITNELRKIVNSVEGIVTNITTTPASRQVEVKLSDGTVETLAGKRVILATGARPRTLQLPAGHHAITFIDPKTAFIQSELEAYLEINPQIKTVAVIGSSHSAALTTMHLLQAGLTVKQFMNKEYKYAKPKVSKDGKGTRFTKFDNTGLKGNVAKFTRELLHAGDSKLTRYIGKDREEVNSLLEEHLTGCSHAVAVIGYEPSATLCINNLPISAYSHNSKTTEFIGLDGVFGIGVAFPQEVKAISGEVEMAVGVGKFWATTSNSVVLEAWKKSGENTLENQHRNPASFFSRLSLEVIRDIIQPMVLDRSESLAISASPKF